MKKIKKKNPSIKLRVKAAAKKRPVAKKKIAAKKKKLVAKKKKVVAKKKKRILKKKTFISRITPERFAYFMKKIAAI